MGDPIAISTFRTWLARAKLGERVVYGIDTGERRVMFPDTQREAYDAFEAGLVRLFQRRRGDGGFDYIAVRTKRPRVPRA